MLPQAVQVRRVGLERHHEKLEKLLEGWALDSTDQVIKKSTALHFQAKS